ncbi:MAG: class I SAM-dependent methyltransferase [Verrucomicrobia bacterium]|nr:class I SAM-dependent methyltransferase [Verrucomicrobiota bacterium]
MAASFETKNIGPAQPFVGCSRDASCRKTLSVFKNKLSKLSPLTGQRVLDVGCGEGSFTLAVTAGFAEVHAIDVQEPGLAKFRERVSGDARFHIQSMSASAMTFPDRFFDTIISIETLEHIPDLAGAVAEFARVTRPGGECLITVPNRWFPFENHGMKIGGREFARRIPLLPYVPPLHDRLSLARVFTVRTLDRLFLANGFSRVALDYLWPTFEHGGNSLQPLLKPLFGLMRQMEKTPVRWLGTSIVVRYLKRI